MGGGKLQPLPLTLSGGGGGGGASFALSPLDWTSVAGVEGVGTGTALTTAAYPDVSVAEGGGQALTSYTQIGGEGLRMVAPSNSLSFCAIDLGTIAAATDGAAAARVAATISGTTAADYTASVVALYGIAIFDGADTAADDWRAWGGGRDRALQSAGAWRDSGIGGRGALTATVQTYTQPRIGVMDLAVVREAATGDTIGYYGIAGQWTQITRVAGGGSWQGAAKVVLLAACNTAGVTLSLDVHQIAPAGVFSGLPRVI